MTSCYIRNNWQKRFVGFYEHISNQYITVTIVFLLLQSFSMFESSIC